MKISTAKLIYFSPTRTTRKALEGIAAGLDVERVEHLDLTRSQADTAAETVQADLVILGAPVYSGRIPQTAVNRISKLKARNVPAVVVVVYGNRAYEDALLELKDLAEAAGFTPMAAGAFIGEHSFSGEAIPIACGRPDEEDMKEATDFGSRIQNKLDGARDLADLHPLKVPGNHPYRERHTLPAGSPTTREALCSLCGTCADVCPVEAITVGDVVTTDAALCIYCCACIKFCPETARVMMVPKVNEIAEKLSTLCADRKTPEWF